MPFYQPVVPPKVWLFLRPLFVASGVASCLMLLFLTGCGTTKWSDTSRTATEQLLLSNAMDRAVGQLNFTALYGKKTWIDSKAIDAATDSKYFISAVRQHLLASGARVMDKEEDANYVVELRAGAVGTDRNDLFYGVPSVSIPTGWASGDLAGTTAIPEIAIYKRTDQRAVVKVGVFAYNKKTNAPVWQSGNIQTESRIRARWVLGTGPFSVGDICEGTELAGSRLDPTLTKIIDLESARSDESAPAPSVTLPVFYTEHEEDEPESKLPKPTIAPLTTGETTPDDPDKKGPADKDEEMLAAGDKVDQTDDAATMKLAQAEPGENSEDGHASTKAERQQVAMIYPPAYLPRTTDTYQPMFQDYGATVSLAMSPYVNQGTSYSQSNVNTGDVSNPNAANTYVPHSTTLPWQNAEQAGAAQLAPGFGSYLR